MAATSEADPVPGYSEMLLDIKHGVERYLDVKHTVFSQYPTEFWNDVCKYCSIAAIDVFIAMLFAIATTIIRLGMTQLVYLPFARHVQMTSLNMSKFPESVFKLTYYTFTWSYLFYLLVLSGRHDYFYRPHHIWQDWSPLTEIPPDVYTIYVVQFGFYFHSVYATCFMDQWRKDSVVMLFHHILSLALLGFSFAARYHKIGLLVLFVHDVTDICLEFTKCSVYMKQRGGKHYSLPNHLSSVGFVIFTGSWFVFRLYWFPLKVLHSAGHSAAMKGPVTMQGPGQFLPFYTFFNIMLLMLQCLNIYWFVFIVILLVKVVTGQMNEVDDTREYEVIEKIGNHSNGGSHDNHDKHRQNGNHSNSHQIRVENGNGIMNGNKPHTKYD